MCHVIAWCTLITILHKSIYNFEDQKILFAWFLDDIRCYVFLIILLHSPKQTPSGYISFLQLGHSPWIAPSSWLCSQVSMERSSGIPVKRSVSTRGWRNNFKPFAKDKTWHARQPLVWIYLVYLHEVGWYWCCAFTSWIYITCIYTWTCLDMMWLRAHVCSCISMYVLFMYINCISLCICSLPAN